MQVASVSVLLGSSPISPDISLYLPISPLYLVQVASVSVLLGSSPTSPLYLPISPLYLVQVASVSVLLGSSVVSLTRNEPWITPVQV